MKHSRTLESSLAFSDKLTAPSGKSTPPLLFVQKPIQYGDHLFTYLREGQAFSQAEHKGNVWRNTKALYVIARSNGTSINSYIKARPVHISLQIGQDIPHERWLTTRNVKYATNASLRTFSDAGVVLGLSIQLEVAWTLA
jgi:hypothetical protein